MARQKTSPLDDLVTITSKLPWWTGVLLALASYLLLHTIAARPIMAITAPATAPGQMGTAVTRGIITALATFGQYVLPLVFCIGATVSAINSARRKKIYDRVESHSDVSAMNNISWGDFERLVSEYYRRLGFQVTREGGKGPDGGVDLVLRKHGETHLVQCKQWKAYKVGVLPIREFYGVMAARGVAGGYFVTSGVYTAEAQEFVRGLNIELIDGSKLKGMINSARKKSARSVINSKKRQPVAIGPALLQEKPHNSTIIQCPECGGQLIKRIAKRGSSAGESFVGCSNYPRCNYTKTGEVK